MNLRIDRKMIAEMVILLSLCGGAWMVLVDPQIKELHELEARIAEAQENPLVRNHATVERLADQLDGVRRRVSEIHRQNGFARDSAKIYGLVTGLAKAHGIVIQRLDPGVSRGGGPAEDQVEVVGFDVRVKGDYAQVAAFLGDLEQIDGFVRPVLLTMTPQGDDSRALVEAHFRCEAMRFGLPDALAGLLGDEHADR